MTEIQKVKAEIKMLQKKLDFLEELEKTKSPVEEAYKDWWGDYPELETDSQYDDTRWQGFQAGYHLAYQEPEENEWKSVALRFGEKLSGYLSDGYYELSPAAWFRWAVFTYGKGQQIKDAVRESVKWCEEHPEKSVEDYLKPQTPEQTAQSLKEAFVEAQQTENWKEIQKLIDEEDNDKNFKNSLNLIKEWREQNKPQTLYDVIADWWDDTFTKKETSLQELVDAIEDWLPKEQSAAGSQNAYVECSVEGFNDCLKKIKGKLR